MKSKYVFGNEYDASQEFGKAKEVYYVESTKEIQDLVKYCQKNRLKITVRGAGSSLTGSSLPNNSVVINMLKMNSIIDISNGIVEPGIILDDLNSILQTNKLYFPIKPSSHAVATIGGMISCNAAGKESISFGKTLDWIEWIELIDSQGNIQIIKKIPEYSEGTLGIITKVKLRLTNLFYEKSYDLFEFDSLNHFISAITKITKKTDILSIEGVGKKTSNLLGKDKYLLFITYKDYSGNYKEKPEIFNQRDGLYSKLSSIGYNIIEDPQADLELILPYLEKNNIHWFGHVGTHIIHPCFKSKEKANQLLQFIIKIKNSDTKNNKENNRTNKTNKIKITGEHGYGLLKKEYRPKNNIDEIIKLKSNLDPFALFNPWLLK